MANAYKRSITIDRTKVKVQRQAGFTVWVAVTSNDFKSTANGGLLRADGFDCAVYSDITLGSLRPFKIVDWDPTLGRLVFAFNGTLNSSAAGDVTDSVFWLGYGDAAQSTNLASPSTTWDTSKYAYVFHGASLSDQIAGTATLTNNGGVTTSTTGPLGTAWVFTGSTSQWLEVSNSIVTGAPTATAALFKASALGVVQAIAGIAASSATWSEGLRVASTNFMTSSWTSNGVTATVNAVDTTNWRYAASRVRATNNNFLDTFDTSGALTTSPAGTTAGGSLASPNTVAIGALRLNGVTSVPFNGMVNLAIFYKVDPEVSSPGWTATQWHALNNAAAFTTLGAQQPATNQAPTVTPTSPSPNAVFPVGSTVSFACTISDTEDGVPAGGVTVTRQQLAGGLGGALTGAETTIGSSTSFSRSDIPLGAWRIRYKVTDSGGLQTIASLDIVSDTAPSGASIVSITNNRLGTPAATSANLSTDTFTFVAATATDIDGGDSLTYTWKTNVGSVTIGTGQTLNPGSLAGGTHTITLEVRDSVGQFTSQTFSSTIPVTSVVPAFVVHPSLWQDGVTVTSPVMATGFLPGEIVDFALVNVGGSSSIAAGLTSLAPTAGSDGSVSCTPTPTLGGASGSNYHYLTATGRTSGNVARSCNFWILPNLAATLAAATSTGVWGYTSVYVTGLPASAIGGTTASIPFCVLFRKGASAANSGTPRRITNGLMGSGGAATATFKGTLGTANDFNTPTSNLAKGDGSDNFVVSVNSKLTTIDEYVALPQTNGSGTTAAAGITAAFRKLSRYLETIVDVDGMKRHWRGYSGGGQMGIKSAYAYCKSPDFTDVAPYCLAGAEFWDVNVSNTSVFPVGGVMETVPGISWSDAERELVRVVAGKIPIFYVHGGVSSEGSIDVVDSSWRGFSGHAWISPLWIGGVTNVIRTIAPFVYRDNSGITRTFTWAASAATAPLQWYVNGSAGASKTLTGANQYYGLLFYVDPTNGTLGNGVAGNGTAVTWVDNGGAGYNTRNGCWAAVFNAIATSTSAKLAGAIVVQNGSGSNTVDNTTTGLFLTTSHAAGVGVNVQFSEWHGVGPTTLAGTVFKTYGPLGYFAGGAGPFVLDEGTTMPWGSKTIVTSGHFATMGMYIDAAGTLTPVWGSEATTAGAAIKSASQQAAPPNTTLLYTLTIKAPTANWVAGVSALPNNSTDWLIRVSWGLGNELERAGQTVTDIVGDTGTLQAGAVATTALYPYCVYTSEEPLATGWDHNLINSSNTLDNVSVQNWIAARQAVTATAVPLLLGGGMRGGFLSLLGGF